MISPYLEKPLRSEAEAEALADQRLRDAAPDLLAALENLLGSIPVSTDNRRSPKLITAWDQACSAIAKARNKWE